MSCSDSSDEAVRASATTNSPCSLDDEVPEQMTEWNSITEELTTSFVDLALRPEYSSHSDRLLPRLEDVFERIEYLTECLATEQKRSFSKLLLAYRSRLDGYAALESAWSRSSTSDRDQAIEQITSSHVDARFAVCEISRSTDGEIPGTKNC